MNNFNAILVARGSLNSSLVLMVDSSRTLRSFSENNFTAADLQRTWILFRNLGQIDVFYFIIGSFSSIRFSVKLLQKCLRDEINPSAGKCFLWRVEDCWVSWLNHVMSARITQSKCWLLISDLTLAALTQSNNYWWKNLSQLRRFSSQNFHNFRK